MKYQREKTWDPRENIFDPQNIHKKNYATLEIPTKKPLRPTKFPWQNILNL